MLHRRLMLCGLGALSLVGCESRLLGNLSACQVYRPSVAKQTFDGRVGAVLVRNAGPREVEVKVYHPDGLGDVELRRRVASGAVLALENADGVRLALGNDWGIQVEQSCMQTLGKAAEYRPGEFALSWEGDSLRPGLDALP